MLFAYHPDFAASLAASDSIQPTIPCGDWEQLRATNEAAVGAFLSTRPPPPDITTDYAVPSVDGATICSLLVPIPLQLVENWHPQS